VRRLIRQHGSGDCALGPRTDSHGPVFDLFEQIGFATGATEPEVLHATRTPFAISGGRPCYVEYIDSPLPKIMKRLAALWIRAVVHHGGTLERNARVAVFRGLYFWSVIALRAERSARRLFKL
jgi:hypothetical protein